MIAYVISTCAHNAHPTPTPPSPPLTPILILPRGQVHVAVSVCRRLHVLYFTERGVDQMGVLHDRWNLLKHICVPQTFVLDTKIK